MSFTGEFRHTIDAKGRLIVPSRLRVELKEDKVVLTKWLDGCIAMWSQSGWEGLERSLREQPNANSQARAVLRGIAAGAHVDAIDKQGRITVPQGLRDYGGITRDVVVTGALSHGEIWSPERWEQEQSKVEEGGLDELAQGLNF